MGIEQGGWWWRVGDQGLTPIKICPMPAIKQADGLAPLR